MAPAVKAAKKKLPATPWGHLPPRMRILFITGLHRTGGWLAEAFTADGASDVQLEEVVGVAAGLARLRDEVFDAVLVSHEGEGLDALELLDAIRAGSSEEQPIVVLGEQSEQELSALCYEAGGDAYVCVAATTTRTLMWEVSRAVERRALIAENRRLHQAQQHRLQLEHEEASRLLRQQRAMIADLENLRFGRRRRRAPHGGRSAHGLVARPDLPQALVDHYRELLRVYVIMGSGNLTEDMSRLGELLASAFVTSHQAMLLHLHVLEEMVRGLGSRSAAPCHESCRHADPRGDDQPGPKLP